MVMIDDFFIYHTDNIRVKPSENFIHYIKGIEISRVPAMVDDNAADA